MPFKGPRLFSPFPQRPQFSPTRYVIRYFSNFKDMYAPESWQQLANSFVLAHHTLYNVPAAPLLHIALSAGLSALKTPSCYSDVPRPPMNFYSDIPTSLCPICSPELNALARNVPYAQHVRNIVDDPVALPNGRVYSQANLEAWGKKQGVSPGIIRDPLTLAEWDGSVLRKVYVM
jgi:macrophage erythroblast attacher